MAITHAKVSAVEDGVDTNLVRPSDWNAAHTGTLDANSIDTGATASGRVLGADGEGGIVWLRGSDEWIPGFSLAIYFDEVGHHVHLYYSLDNTQTWTEITTDFTDYIRDPSITFYNNKFWIAGTSTGASTDLIPVYSSSDLTTWTKIVDIDTSALGAPYSYSWAPTWFIDADKSVHILFSNNKNWMGEIYEMHPTNAAWTTWSNLVQVTGTSFPTIMIDPFLLLVDNTYYLFYKDDDTDFICLATSSSPFSGYTVIHTGDWASWGQREGICVSKVDDIHWRAYFNTTLTNGIYMSESDDLFATWTAPAAVSELSVRSHGDVLQFRDFNAYKIFSEAIEPAFTLSDHDHSGDAGDGGTFDAANLTSGESTDGQVLTSDGSGGAAWEDAAASGSITVEEIDGTPSVADVVKIKVPNGSLTDDGSGVVTFTPAGTGDVVGPASAADGHMAVFDSTTGKLIKDGGAVPAGTTFVGARYNSNAAQTIVNNTTIAIIDFEDQVYDTGTLVTTGASWKFTAPSTGYYHIDCMAMFAATTTFSGAERVLLQLFKNNSVLLTLDRADAFNADSTTAITKGSVTVNLTATDYIDVRIAQNSGGNLSLSNDAGQVWINIEKV